MKPTTLAAVGTAELEEEEEEAVAAPAPAAERGREEGPPREGGRPAVPAAPPTPEKPPLLAPAAPPPFWASGGCNAPLLASMKDAEVETEGAAAEREGLYSIPADAW